MEKGALRINKGSIKICKGDKNQVMPSMKVLRPKVYITDSSSFKRLVQELTGNGSNDTPFSSSLKQEKIPNFDVDNYGEPYDYCSRSEFVGGMELSENLPTLDDQSVSPLATFTPLKIAWLAQEMNNFENLELDVPQGGIDSFPFYNEDALFPIGQMAPSFEHFLQELYDIL